jgi:hypothetical protein
MALRTEIRARTGPEFVPLNPRPWVFATVLLLAAGIVRQIAASTQDRLLSDPTLQGTFGELTPAHIVGLAFGLANAQFGLVGWAGGSRFLQGGLHLPQLFDLAITSVALVTLLALAVWIARAWQRTPALRRPILILGLWFVIPLGFAAWWGNAYTKLWVLPVAGWWALLSVPLWGRPSQGRWTSAVAFVCVVAAVDVGVHLAPNHYQPAPALSEADILNRKVGLSDLVVATGWEAVGVDFGSLYQKPYVSYIDAAYRYRSQQGPLNDELNRSICVTLARGGHVYAVALLDLNHNQWSDFLGRRLHLDYEALAPLRQSSRRVQLELSGDVEPVRLIDRGIGC